jgi:molybdopterin-containing oxidoreductase family iron-sulfur binding subunit
MSDRGYWRSLEALAGEPAAREFLEREFPEGASEPAPGVTRREVLTLLGASLSLAGAAACRRPVEKIVPFAEAPEDFVPGVPVHYATTLPFGLDAYGLLVQSHEGRPTKIEGNELHPSTSGRSSALVQASILGLYDPDRSRSVHHGEAGQKQWADFVAAWAETEASHLSDGGAALAVLSESFASPTLARLADAFGRRFPAARWATYEPVSDETIHRGLELATGRPLQPLFHFDRARVVLAVDCDFLRGESGDVRNAAGFAASRAVDAPGRLWVVEGDHSLTGANADHRYRLSSGSLGAFLWLLAEQLGLSLPAAERPRVPGVEARWLEPLAADLAAHPGAGLVVAGRRQPAEVHAAVCALNAALGNAGTTVVYRELIDARRPSTQELVGLVGAMRAGQVRTLVVLGGNPVYATPADLDFAGALSGVEQLVHLGAYRDETGARARWHVPRAHFLEAWGDARSIDGTPSVIQPLIEPLFGARSDVELLGLLATGADRPGHDLVRETWAARLGDADFERRWSRILHDGLDAEEAPAPVVAEPRPEALAGLGRTLRGGEAAGSGELELVFRASPAVFDGRFANNGWLQELPDSMTKLTWDNAALVAPATARALGIRNEDVLRLGYAGRRLELPAWILPGLDERTVVVDLGYGRSHGGRIAAGRGANAYALRTSDAPSFGRGLTLERTGERYTLAQTQDHGTMAGRPIVREATLDEYRHEPAFAREAVHKPFDGSLWPEWTYEQGYQWGMSIDLNTCTGCNACVIACQSENNVPVVGKEQVFRGREMHWLRVDRYFSGADLTPEDDPQTVFQAVPCMHCENAPCEQVCPVAATVHDGEGLNVMVYNRCIGTRYCSNNCPYKVRRFNFYNFTKDTPEVLRLANNPDVTVRSRGVMEKCSYCVQRIHAKKIDAKRAGRELGDGDVLTACQQACPARAIEFGNILDPASRVRRAKSLDRSYALLDELQTKPRTTYLAKLRNPHPDLAS